MRLGLIRSRRCLRLLLLLPGWGWGSAVALGLLVLVLVVEAAARAGLSSVLVGLLSLAVLLSPVGVAAVARNSQELA